MEAVAVFSRLGNVSRRWEGEGEERWDGTGRVVGWRRQVNNNEVVVVRNGAV